MKKTIILFLLIALFCGSAISCSQAKEENDAANENDISSSSAESSTPSKKIPISERTENFKEWESMTKEEQEELLYELEHESEAYAEKVDEKSLLPPPINSEQWDVIFWLGVGVVSLLIVGGVFLFGKKKK